MSTLKQSDLLRSQQEEMSEVANDLQLNIPGPEGTVVRTDAGGVSEAGGVPLARDPKVNQQLEALKKARQVAAIRASVETGSKTGGGKDALRMIDLQIQQLSGTSPDLPERPKSTTLYADGSSHGFIARSDSSGKVKDILFANGPGGSRVPTLQDIVRMTTEPVTNKASADLKKQAGAAVQRWTQEMNRRGANQDFQNFVGEYIQKEREDRVLSLSGVKERVNNVQRDNSTAHNRAMTELFGDDYKDQLGQVSTSTVDPTIREADMKAIETTVTDWYNRMKNSPLLKDKTTLRASTIGMVLGRHKDQLASFGVHGADRAIKQVLNGLDTMRNINFQQQLTASETTAAAEIDAFERSALNTVIASTQGMDPVGLVDKVNDAYSKSIEIDDASQLGLISMSQRVQQDIEAARAEIKATLLPGVDSANLLPEKQKEFVTTAYINMLGQEIAFASADQRPLLADQVNKMREASAAGTFEENFSHLVPVRDFLHKQYFHGINRVTQERLKHDISEQRKRATRAAEASNRLQNGHWMTLEDNKFVWHAPSGSTESSRARQSAKGRKQMMKNTKILAEIQNEVGGSAELMAVLEGLDNKERAGEQEALIRNLQLTQSPALQGSHIAGTISNAPRGPIPQKATATDAQVDRAFEELRVASVAGETNRVNALSSQLAKQLNVSRDEVLSLLDLPSPRQ